MKKLFILLALIFAINSWSSPCPHPLAQEDGLCLDVQWEEGPRYDAYSKAKLTVYRVVEGKHVATPPSREVVPYPWMIMPNMEHGARPVVVQELGPGTYEVSKIYFTKMPGHWEMRLRYEDSADKKNPLVKVPVEFP